FLAFARVLRKPVEDNNEGGKRDRDRQQKKGGSRLHDPMVAFRRPAAVNTMTSSSNEGDTLVPVPEIAGILLRSKWALGKEVRPDRQQEGDI
ncbi:MAG: hypothetical protein JO313_13050, partial [Verrucomicrobia bacterium]|nr:hypothetical protein [Verrucomicrobiota bacterium]